MGKKINLNFSLFSFVIYIIFIILNDYLCFFFKFNSNITSYIISLILTIFICFIFRKKLNIKKDEFNNIDVIFIMLILLVWFARFAIPDSSFDTLNYHIYIQENLFSDNVNFNFFPARWINTFSLPLGDRMHYFFRLLLGYRLGMIINIICVIVIYYQLKYFLSYFIKNKDIAAISSIFIIITEQILSNMVSYYVDLLVIPIFLQILIIIFDNDENILNNYFVLLLTGIAISLKISNAILLIPLAIIYIYKYRKSINYKTFLIGIPLVLFPVIIYLLNNYIQTGNPVFPFYNSIFGSKYLENSNWIENGYGPKNIIERLIWPVYSLIDTRRTFDTDIYYGRICFGYIFSIIGVLISIYKLIKNKNKLNLIFYFSSLYIVLCFFWSNFMMGYIRYALILEILSGIICILIAKEYYNSKKFLKSLFSILAIFSLIAVSFLSMGDLLVGNREFSWRYPYIANKQAYKNNLKHLFDKDNNYSNRLENISCIGIVDYNSGYASMLSNDIPIIGINEGYINNYGKQKYNKIINKCKNIYTISTSITYNRTMDYLNKSGYEQADDVKVFKTDYLDYNYDFLLIEIRKKDSIK